MALQSSSPEANGFPISSSASWFFFGVGGSLLPLPLVWRCRCRRQTPSISLPKTPKEEEEEEEEDSPSFAGEPRKCPRKKVCGWDEKGNDDAKGSLEFLISTPSFSTPPIQPHLCLWQTSQPLHLYRQCYSLLLLLVPFLGKHCTRLPSMKGKKLFMMPHILQFVCLVV